MEFRLLGPIELRSDGIQLPIGPPQRRAVLAALLIDVGHPVPLATFVDRVWDEAVPEAPHSALYAHLARLRGLLDRAGARALGVSLRRASGGYVLDADPELVDLHRFRRQIAYALEPDRDDALRVAALHAVMGMWRGVPLTDVPGEWAARIREAIERQYVGAVTAWAAAALRLGRPETMVDELSEVVSRYPLAEPLVAVLLRTLLALGRAPEALEYYVSTQRRLADQLDIEPGAELRDLHSRILRGDGGPPPARPGPGRPVVAGPQPTGVPVVPAQLPLETAGFTGRATELARLDGLLVEEAAGSPVVVISSIVGTAGVGKTALALRWAHRATDRFPDGQLYVDLRGYDPEQPVSADDALGSLLRALGVSNAEIPTDRAERAALMRTMVTGRRILLVLDNAASVEQVRPLLPGSGSCRTVVTSRDSLAGLAVREGVHRLELDLLPPVDAVNLLCLAVGERARADPAATVALAERCARLPLALRVAAQMAVSRPHLGLAELTAELADEQERLDRLGVVDDARSAVTAVFWWSYRHLSQSTARAFRLLGAHPGRTYDAFSLAALLDSDLASAQGMLDALVDAHLIGERAPGRYAMHDLLRAFARRLAHRHDDEGDRAAALTRLFDYYRHASAVAIDLLHPAERQRRPQVAPVSSPVPALAAEPAARWLEAERPNLVAVVGHAAEQGWYRHTTDLASILFREFNVRGHLSEAQSIHRYALAAARRLGDREAEAQALTNVGIGYGTRGDFARAADWYDRALSTFAELGNALGQARTLYNLGVVATRQGDDDTATEYFRRALKLFRQADDQTGEAAALGSIGMCLRRLGRHEEGMVCCVAALDLARAVGDRRVEAQQLSQLGAACLHCGEDERAASFYHRALAVARELGDRARQGESLCGLGEVALRQGQHDRAAEHYELAVAIAEEIGDAHGRTVSLNGLAQVLQAAGRPARVYAHATTARSLSRGRR